MTTLKVKTLSGKTHLIEMEPSDLIKDLKEKIHEKESVEPDRQSLLYCGKQLEDNCTISDYKLSDKHYIHLVIKH